MAAYRPAAGRADFARQLCAAGLRALWRGRRCIVPDWWNRLFVPLFFYMPDFVTRRIRRFTIRFQR